MKNQEDEDGHVDTEGVDLDFDDEVESDEDGQVVEVVQAPRIDCKGC